MKPPFDQPKHQHEPIYETSVASSCRSLRPSPPMANLISPAFDRLIESQIAGGVEGLLILGTTGEGPCVPRALRRPLIERAVATARKRILHLRERGGKFPRRRARQRGGVISRRERMPSPCCRRSIFRRSPVELTAWFRALLDAAGRTGGDLQHPGHHARFHSA